MGENLAICDISLASLNALQDVEMILDIRESRIVGHPGYHFACFLFLGHKAFLTATRDRL
jgi:hypothetical protein